MNKYFSFFILGLFITSSGSFSWAKYDPMNPTSFDHQVRKREYKCYPNLKIKLSIARVHDNKVLDTPYGRETGGVSIVGLNSQSPAVVKSPTRYDTSRDEVGYGKKTRELLSYHLASVKSIQLIEREDINTIVREWDFGDTKYVKKSDKKPAIEMPRLLARGFLTSNDGSCLDNDEEEEAWGLEKEGDNDKLQFLLRLYDTETSHVKLIACGTGNTGAEAVKGAIKDLKKHRDLLFPTVRVIDVRDKQIELDGGSNQGISRDTRFYLIRTAGSKEDIDNYDDLEYIAFCKVINAGSVNAKAVVTELLSDVNPRKGDLVFYYFPEEEW